MINNTAWESLLIDTLNHSVLVKKLERYGVRGLPLDWLTNYLKGCKQFVSVDGRYSELKTCNIGVPQGSILGSILFLTYINDLPNVSSIFSSILYADDTTLLTSNADYNLISDINNELPKLQRLVVNLLTLNLDKILLTLFSNRHDSVREYFDTVFNNNRINSELIGEFLRLTIDENMKFISHIRIISRKISRSVEYFIN